MELNDAQKAYLDTLIPEGTIALGFHTIAAYMDEDGNTHWRSGGSWDKVPVSQVIGFLETAKASIVLREVARGRHNTEDEEDNDE